MTEGPMTENTGLTDARSRALEFRELNETLEQRIGAGLTRAVEGSTSADEAG
jgi:hypothetical protein